MGALRRSVLACATRGMPRANDVPSFALRGYAGPMEEIKPRIPDIIELLTAEMERRGIASRKVAEFRQLWNQLQPY